MIQQGNLLIKEVYRGDKLIGQIYRGSRKVYDVNRFPKGQVLVLKSPGEYRTTLPRGVFQVAIGGSQGSPTSWVYNKVGWTASGGGGGFIELVFYNPRPREIVLASFSSGDAYMNLGGARILTARAGANASVNNGGTGGSYTVGSGLDILRTIKAANGNNGRVNLGGEPSLDSVSNYGNWGATANRAGGIRLQYLRYVR